MYKGKMNAHLCCSQYLIKLKKVTVMPLKKTENYMMLRKAKSEYKYRKIEKIENDSIKFRTHQNCYTPTYTLD